MKPKTGFGRVSGLFIGLAIVLANASQGAEFSSSADLSTGYTSNVLFEKEGGDSDGYLRGRLGLFLSDRSESFGFRFTYTDYFKADSRDLLAPRLSYQRADVLGDWDFSSELSHFNYIRTAPGYEDFAFDSVGAGVALGKEVRLNPSLEMSPSFRYGLSRYLKGAPRTDHALGAELEFLAPLKNSVLSEIYFGSDLTLLLSSDANFSTRAFGLFAGSVARLSPRQSLDFGFILNRAVYLERTQSTITEVRVRRGVTRTQIIEDSEYRNFLQLHAEYSQRLSEAFRFRSRLNTARQISGSGAQDYSVLDLEVGLALDF